MKIGIYGGTFNPPHLGHLVTAEHILREFKLDFIYFIPVYQTRYKEIKIKAEVRYRMLRLALNGNKKLVPNSIEIDSKDISYTIDTIKKIYRPGNRYYLIIGNEWLPGFNKWKGYREIFTYCRLIVARRTGNRMSIPAFLRPFRKKIFISSNPLIEISSSRIQEMRKKGMNIKYCTTPKVYDYIQRNRLYDGRRK
ncbi:MAG: nicotinate (nicotinamide) nucleotide adenylyltransferase [bacterium]|nr:nicotinate (nicotinamide) nucleotide adenylyltransferase [bacterium]